MDGNCGDEQTRRKIAIGIEKALHKAGWPTDYDAIRGHPSSTKKKSTCLMHIGNHEVVDEDEKLVWRLVSFLTESTDILLMYIS